MRSYAFISISLTLLGEIQAWQNPIAQTTLKRVTRLQAFGTQEKIQTQEKVESRTQVLEKGSINNLEETTEKFGLEAGLIESVKSGDGDSAKSLLKKYGVAYLATSIPLAIISFSICYFLVQNGVDVSSLLAKIGIETSDTAEQAGTVAIAYAAHKAASPIRFPPTVLLTPVVAKIIGKEPAEEEN